MPLSNSPTRYGAVAKIFHWSIALGIFAAIPLGILANDASFGTAGELARKAWLFSLHKTVGVTIFFVALARIAWALSQPKPVPLHPERRFETLAAETVHWLLYGSLVLVPLSGWAHHAATTGFAPILWPFGQSLPFVPKDAQLAERLGAAHVILERVLLLSLLLHVAGALKHAVIDRDATLARMLPGRTEAGSGAARHPVFAPLAGALSVWALAIGLGAAAGAFAPDGRSDRPALAAVASDWTVQEGTLGLTIRQFGSEVRGSFADWTAAISFDASVSEGPAGNVAVTIAIGSLGLGSVTAQALGPDYFDADRFPTATFSGPILIENGALRVDGTLNLRGATVPVSLPFDLALNGDTATASGRVVLDRRAFGIGSAMTDPAQLGFEVVVDFALTATR